MFLSAVAAGKYLAFPAAQFLLSTCDCSSQYDWITVMPYCTVWLQRHTPAASSDNWSLTLTDTSTLHQFFITLYLGCLSNSALSSRFLCWRSTVRVTTDVTLINVASTMVGARLDNAILYETSKSNIQRIQRSQNSIARIVTDKGDPKTSRASDSFMKFCTLIYIYIYIYITSVLTQWLKIAERIEYKVALLTFKALTTGKPDCTCLTSFSSALQ